MIFQLISILYYLKKLKYYACISIVGSLAMNYYFFRFMMKNIWNFGVKIKDYSVVSLVVLSLLLVFL